MNLARSLSALTLTLATSAGIAAAQSPIIPGHGGLSLGAQSSCAPTTSSVVSGERHALSTRNVRHRARLRSHRATAVRRVRGGTCAPHRTQRIYQRRVWVPGYYRTVYRPARFEIVCTPCGGTRRVLVEPAYNEQVWVPGRYEIRRF